MASVADNNIHFFSHSSILHKEDLKRKAISTEESTPFGLSFQQPFPKHDDNGKDGRKQGATMGQSPTQSLTGSDSCVDFDIEW